jgi:hypothetical protein
LTTAATAFPLPQPDPTAGAAATYLRCHENEIAVPRCGGISYTPMTTLNINGQSYQVDVPSNTPLLWVLRDILHLTGTK